MLLILGGCDDVPKDPFHTTETVRQTGILRAGIVADGGAEAAERSVLLSIAAAAGARADTVTGGGEALLHQLEDGELDVVVGEFAKGSPWTDRVAFSPAAGGEDAGGEEESGRQPAVRAAVRAGENGWLMLVTRSIRGAR